MRSRLVGVAVAVARRTDLAPGAGPGQVDRRLGSGHRDSARPLRLEVCKRGRTDPGMIRCCRLRSASTSPKAYPRCAGGRQVGCPLSPVGGTSRYSMDLSAAKNPLHRRNAARIVRAGTDSVSFSPGQFAPTHQGVNSGSGSRNWSTRASIPLAYADHSWPSPFGPVSRTTISISPLAN